MNPTTGSKTSAFLAGVLASLPLSVGIIPFGLVYGVAVVESPVADWVGGIASTIILAGASQLALVDLIDSGAPWTVAVGTALVINARFIMYSGALAPSFAEYPGRWRIPLAHLMTDQAAVMSLLYNDTDTDPVRRMHYYAGAGLTFAGVWALGTWLGVFLGANVPESLQLGFAIPLMFLAMLIPSIRNRPSAVAAVVGGGVTVLADGAPFSTSLLIGTACGIAAGMMVRR